MWTGREGGREGGIEGGNENRQVHCIYLKGKAATAARSRRRASVCFVMWMGREAGSQSMWPSRRPMREMKPGERAVGAEGGREGGGETGKEEG